MEGRFWILKWEWCGRKQSRAAVSQFSWNDEDSYQWNLDQIGGISKPRMRLSALNKKGSYTRKVDDAHRGQVVLPSLACLSFRILSRRDCGIFWKASSDGARMVQGCSELRSRVTNPDCSMALASSEKRPSWKYNTSLSMNHIRIKDSGPSKRREPCIQRRSVTPPRTPESSITASFRVFLVSSQETDGCIYTVNTIHQDRISANFRLSWQSIFIIFLSFSDECRDSASM